MNESVWTQDGRRRREWAVPRAYEMRAAGEASGTVDPIGPGPLLGVGVLGIASGLPLAVMAVGVVVVLAVRDAFRHRRAIALVVGRIWEGVPRWSSAHISR